MFQKELILTKQMHHKNVKVIKEGAFEGTYFRNTYSNVTGKCYKKNHGKNSIS